MLLPQPMLFCEPAAGPLDFFFPSFGAAGEACDEFTSKVWAARGAHKIRNRMDFIVMVLLPTGLRLTSFPVI